MGGAKYLSRVALGVIRRCAQACNAAEELLVDEFEATVRPPIDDYPRKLVEFAAAKAIGVLCDEIGERIDDGSFSRFTFDMMLAWEQPSSSSTLGEEADSEKIAKEQEDRKTTLQTTTVDLDDEIPLFYSDILPLLVDEKKNVGEDAFVWLTTLLPLPADIVNARFVFETLTASSALRLHYPAYDRYLKEIDQIIKYTHDQSSPKGYELAKDEFILHVDGTTKTQRVIRHIGTTNWPGRITLTNYALYFEACGVLSYENALKIDLADLKVDHQVKPALTGPWGAPLFDKAITYQSSELSEPVVFEFPEMSSSTRRDLWLSLIKEVILLHQFLWKFGLNTTAQAWEMHARTILAVLRLHSARELMRMSPPPPPKFLIFSLYEELPKGDYVLEELANNAKKVDISSLCSVTWILKSLNICHPLVSEAMEVEKGGGIEEGGGGSAIEQYEALACLDSAISQAREEAKEVGMAKATVEGLKEEGIAESVAVLMELLGPLNKLFTWLKKILTWKKPVFSFLAISTILIVIYTESFGYGLSSFFLCLSGKMLMARHRSSKENRPEMVVCTSSEKTTVESLVAAQHGLRKADEVIKMANIAILKVKSIFEDRAPKHANQVLLALFGLAVLLSIIPFKFVLIAATICCFAATAAAAGNPLPPSSFQGNRRLREWWESIPITPIRVTKSHSD